MINDPCLSQLEQCYRAGGEWYIFIFSGPSSKNKVFPFQKRSSKGAAAEIQPDSSCKCFTYCRKNMQKSIGIHHFEKTSKIGTYVKMLSAYIQEMYGV